MVRVQKTEQTALFGAGAGVRGPFGAGGLGPKPDQVDPEHTQSTETKCPTPQIPVATGGWWRDNTHLVESLILAQDQRWRRA